MESRLEDLLELIEQKSKDKEEDNSKDKKVHWSIKKFIREHSIERGLDRVPTYVLFYHYRKLWTKTTNQNKVNKIVFGRGLKALGFEQVRTGKQRYYLLDGSRLDLSREVLLEAKYYDERYAGEKRNKAKKKKDEKGEG